MQHRTLASLVTAAEMKTKTKNHCNLLLTWSVRENSHQERSSSSLLESFKEVICFPVIPLCYQAVPLTRSVCFTTVSSFHPMSQLFHGEINSSISWNKLSCTILNFIDQKQHGTGQVNQNLCKLWAKDRAETPLHSKYSPRFREY